MSASAPYALSTKPLSLHSQCYLGISPMAPGRRSQLTTSPTMVEGTYWCAIYSASIPSSTRSQPGLFSHGVHACTSSSLSMGHYPCSIWMMAHHLLLMTSHSSSSAIPLTTSFPSPTFQGLTASECQVFTIKTVLSTSQDSRKTLEDLLLDLCSTLIGPNLPSSREILLNRTLQHPSRPSTPVNMESVRNYFLSRKQSLKVQFD